MASTIPNSQASLALTVFVQTAGIFPSNDPSDPSEGSFLAQIGIFAGGFGPNGAPLANGQALPINQNTALFSLLGFTYGGNGSSTFALPNLGGTALIEAGTGPGLATYNLGSQTGSSSITLSPSQLPANLGGSSQPPFDNYQPSLPIHYIINVTGFFPSPNSGTPNGFLGEIIPFAGTFAPSGWMFADGQELSIADFDALFQIIGTTYGGDGNTTFALPDLRGRDIVGASANNPLGTPVGQPSVLLTSGQMPANLGGSAQPFDNREPSLALNYLIALAGIFPSQSGGGQLDDVEPLLGQVVAFAGDFAPRGWALAQGQILSIAQDTALFSLLGTNFGGNGQTTFALPNLQDHTIVGTSNNLTIGTEFGSNSETVDFAELPLPTVSSGQVVSITNGQTSIGLVVLSGGIVEVFSGGTASVTTVENGGMMEVLSGGSVISTGVQSGGTLDFRGTASANNTTVSSGGVAFVSSGTVGGTTVSAGIESVQPGGIAVGTILNSGGLDVVNVGGSANGAIVNSGTQQVLSGGVASGAVLNNGGNQVVMSGGVASATTVNNGGQEGVHGSAINALVNSGGKLYVYSGAVASGTTVASGGVAYAFSSGVLSATIMNGGIESVQPGGLAVGTILNSSGIDVVNSGGRTSGAIVNGARQNVFGGGVASGTTLNNGGLQVVFSGGGASATTINSGGQEGVYGSAVGAIVNSGGNLYVNSGAVASGATVVVGGVAYAFSNGVVSGTIVSGGIESVQPGGLAVGTILNSGGIDVINVGGSANGAIVNSGTQQVLSGGVASGAVLNSAGSQVVMVGAVASATTINSGGQDGVHGSAVGMIINNGGKEYVWSGGFDSGAHVNSGGFEIVTSGGTASAPVISGGTLEIMSGGSTGAGALTFASSGGGILQLDHSQSFAGTVAGFGEPDFIDLRDIVFGSATTLVFTEAPSNTSGTLSVSDGTHTANITLLGQYVTGQFTKASDGAGGTLVGDPPVEEAMTDPRTIGLVNPHHA